MKLILNTVIEPHFVSLFDESGTLRETHTWTDKRKDGSEIFSFCQKHNISQEKITFLGGVSGPGGFSSLRVASCILNALSFTYDLPVHQIRAEIWAQKLLGHTDFFLNTFGQYVWSISGEKLERIALSEANERWANTKKFLGFLPPEKQSLLDKILPMEVDVSSAAQMLFSCLEATSPQKSFLPEYDFPAVQKNS